jgi:hypothetical protein
MGVVQEQRIKMGCPDMRRTDGHGGPQASLICKKCRQPLEEWEVGFCEGCGMKKTEAKQHAAEIVWRMLSGRCCPEVSDVDDITEDEIEQEMIIEAINAVLDRLSKQLQNKSVIR